MFQQALQLRRYPYVIQTVLKHSSLPLFSLSFTSLSPIQFWHRQTQDFVKRKCGSSYWCCRSYCTPTPCSAHPRQVGTFCSGSRSRDLFLKSPNLPPPPLSVLSDMSASVAPDQFFPHPMSASGWEETSGVPTHTQARDRKWSPIVGSGMGSRGKKGGGNC